MKKCAPSFFCHWMYKNGLNLVILTGMVIVLGLTTGCSSGTSNIQQTLVPSNLIYPQTTITGSVGQAITTNTPTVTGTVTSYAVSPALPAGLALNATTGAISGTPTAAAVQAAYTVTASNSTGSTTAAIQIVVNAALAPPSNLAYPQVTITATVGQAITTDTPTVTGTVTSYAVSPALPAGLALNATTGAISGTPTAAAAQAAYTVTATNSAGSTTAAVQIIVNAAVTPPTNLIYPQTTITGSVGQAITTDIPYVVGTVVSYAVTPALPAGLNLDTSTGAISGTPTTATAQAAYTVTATNSGGSATTSITITVGKALITLLDLGHANGINILKMDATRVLSRDTSGHWALWDYTANTELASGDQVLPSNTSTPLPIDLAGPTISIGLANGMELRSASDGHLLSTIIDSTNSITWWKLASDGSYISGGSKSGVSVWSLTGQVLVSRQGDYSKAEAFAAPDELRVALGAAGQNVIETISISAGSSSNSPAFSGSFNSWFLDGERFLTNTGTTVWTYTKLAEQQAIVTLPTVQSLTGQGNWLWISTDTSPGVASLSIYNVIGGSAPTVTYNLASYSTFFPSGTTLSILPEFTSQTTSIVDLSGSSPTKVDINIPMGYPTVLAATSTSQWIVGDRFGVVLDGASLSGTPRYLSGGTAFSIAGGTGRAAVAVAKGDILYFDPAVKTIEGTISFPSTKVILSSDGTELAAAGLDLSFGTDRTLNIFSLPTGTVISSRPYQASSTPTLLDFSLSSSGTTLGQVLQTSSGGYMRQATPVTSDTPILWSDTPPDSKSGIQFSPDGTLIAVSSSSPTGIGPEPTTNIFKNGQIVTAVPGWVVGWIDNDRILVNSYVLEKTGLTYSGAAIYDATGAKLASTTLPELQRLQQVDSNSVYSPDLGSIFSLTTGAATWTSISPITGVGAVAGSYVVFASGSRVVVDSY